MQQVYKIAITVIGILLFLAAAMAIFGVFNISLTKTDMFASLFGKVSGG